jgi:hypothetical protein
MTIPGILSLSIPEGRGSGRSSFLFLIAMVQTPGCAMIHFPVY